MLDSLFSAPFWQYSFFSNPVLSYAYALAIFLGVLVALKIFQKIVLARLRKLSKRTKTQIDDLIVSAVQSLRPPFYLVLALWLSLRSLSLGFVLESIVDAFLVMVVVYQVVVSLYIPLDYISHRRFQDPTRRQAFDLIAKIAKGVLWAFAVLLVLSNLGFDITSLVAGLGIGGIAIALALQNILSDLFSSFAIYFDKPFEVGDFIVVGDAMGVVKRIGVKTTRITSLQGEEVVLSNKELTTSRIQNFKKMKERRVVFRFGVEYSTSQDQLSRIPSIVKKVVEDISGTHFDRTHFFSFGASSLDFEVVYYVESDDYNTYMDTLQAVHLGIKGELEKEGVAFAFPSRTVYLQKI